MQPESAPVTVSITQQGIEEGMATCTRNPMALALARELSTDKVFVSQASHLAFDLTPPYRAIYLPPEAIGWLRSYALHDAQHPAQPCTFEVRITHDGSAASPPLP